MPQADNQQKRMQAAATSPSREVRFTSSPEQPKKRYPATVRYNKHLLKKRLDVEEWLDSQLRLLYKCAVSTHHCFRRTLPHPTPQSHSYKIWKMFSKLTKHEFGKIYYLWLMQRRENRSLFPGIFSNSTRGRKVAFWPFFDLLFAMFSK